MCTIDQVRQFHLAFGHPVASGLDVGTPELRILRVKLIAEELQEFARACGVSLILSCDPRKPESTDFLEAIHREDCSPNLVEMADALGDIDYVTQGANLVFGIPAAAVMNEIQGSNMSKLGEDGKPLYREDGKILKGPNYFKPNIAKALGVE